MSALLQWSPKFTKWKFLFSQSQFNHLRYDSLTLSLSQKNCPKIYSILFFYQVAGLAWWWEHLPSTNVARVRFPHPVSYVDWVCWFSTLLWEVFPQVLRFSPLIKNQHLIWFVNNDCKNNDLGNIDLIFSRIVKRIWKLNCWICAIEINVIIINYYH